MIWILRNVLLCFEINFIVIEHATVAHGPVAEDEHGDWCVLSHVEGVLVKRAVVHGRLAVPVGEEETLVDVEVDDTEQSDGEENWDKHAVSETDKDHHDYGGVFVMHQVYRSRIQINIRFLSCALRLSSLPKDNSTVHPSLKNSNDTKNYELQPWHESLDKHGLN